MNNLKYCVAYAKGVDYSFEYAHSILGMHFTYKLIKTGVNFIAIVLSLKILISYIFSPLKYSLLIIVGVMSKLCCWEPRQTRLTLAVKDCNPTNRALVKIQEVFASGTGSFWSLLFVFVENLWQARELLSLDWDIHGLQISYFLVLWEHILPYPKDGLVQPKHILWT